MIRIVGVLHKLGFIEVTDGASRESTAVAKKQALLPELLIPEIRNPNYSEKLEVLKNRSSFISEQFASLKVQIDGLGIDKRTQVIVISSADRKAGKSLISSNLALSLARDPGRKVILLDCDLRNPSLHNSFGIPIEPGMIEYLSDSTLPPHCYVRRLGPLYVMTAGGIADNPVELLSHHRMRELIEYLRREFDSIVVDSSPLRAISDTHIVFRLADGIIMVIRRGRTGYRDVEKAFKTLDPDKFLGIVFNDVKPGLIHTCYDYHDYPYAKSSSPVLGSENGTELGRKNASVNVGASNNTPECHSRTVSNDLIRKVVAGYYSLKVFELSAKDNSRKVVEPRQIAMFLCRELSGSSLSQIGRDFGDKHPTTVLRSIRKIERLRNEDPRIKNTVNKLTAYIPWRCFNRHSSYQLRKDLFRSPQ